MTYYARGWTPIPLAAGTKNTLNDGFTRVRYDSEAAVRSAFGATYKWGSAHNVGLLVGEASGWLTDVDLDVPEARLLAPLFLPPTGMRHGRPSERGGHWWYILTEPAKGTAFTDPVPPVGAVAKIVEFRTGTMGQTVVPPSMHPDGEPYMWEADGEPARIEPGVLLTAVRRLAAAVLLARHWPGEGSRDDAALHLNGALARAEWTTDEMRAFIGAVGRAAHDEEWQERARKAERTVARLRADEPTTGWPTLSAALPLGGEAVVTRVRAWLQAPRGPVSGPPTPVPPGVLGYPGGTGDRTDLANARRFVALHGGSVRYCTLWKSWLSWSGVNWVMDEVQDAETRARDVLMVIEEERARAMAAGQFVEARVLAEWTIDTMQRWRLTAITKLAQAEPGIGVRPELFDTDPWLLNCANGTVDLQTGMLLPHEPSQFLMKLVPVAYDGGAQAPRWERFLEEVLPDAGTRAYVHQALGYAMCGVTRHHALFIAYGEGSNGKTTLLETVRRVMGTYGVEVPVETVLAQRSGSTQHPTALTDLHGARFAKASEPGGNRALAEELIKVLTGGDVIRARRMYENFWSFLPTHKLWLMTNHKPNISGTDTGIWRRIRLIPFLEKFEGRREVLGLGEWLVDHEAEGILAWLVRGCLQWQALGLTAPPSVVAATEEYRTEQDSFASFIAECCFVGKGDGEFSLLYAAFKAWADRTNERKLSFSKFGTTLAARGHTAFPGTDHVSFRKGIRAKPEAVAFSPNGHGESRGAPTPFDLMDDS